MLESDFRGEGPRERLFRLGPASLTNGELVAILMGTGAAGLRVSEVARQVLELGEGSLRRLSRRPAAGLATVPGVGEAKAARVAAALELGRRLAAERAVDAQRIRSPGDVYRICSPGMADLDHEEFRVLALDTQNRIIRELVITRGILNGSLVHPREVFRAAIVEAAAGVVAVHNHPSGDPTPSPEDRAVTEQLREAGKVLDVPLHDHVIVGSSRYFSFAEAGLL